MNGTLQAPPEGALGDPGQLTRYGLPAARSIRNAAAALTIGALALAAMSMATPGRMTATAADRIRRTFLEIAAVAGFGWTWSGVATMLLAYSDFAGISLLSPGGLDYVLLFTVQVDLGRALLLNLLNAMGISIACLFVRSDTGHSCLRPLGSARCGLLPARAMRPPKPTMTWLSTCRRRTWRPRHYGSAD